MPFNNILKVLYTEDPCLVQLDGGLAFPPTGSGGEWWIGEGWRSPSLPSAYVFLLAWMLLMMIYEASSGHVVLCVNQGFQVSSIGFKV